MRGYASLITQHYPTAGKKYSRFDLVIETELNGPPSVGLQAIPSASLAFPLAFPGLFC